VQINYITSEGTHMTSTKAVSTVAKIASNTTISKGISVADVATAKKLKPAINDVMMRVRVGLTVKSQEPKWDAAANVFRAKNGHPLVSIELDKKIPGSADMIGRTGLVDPKTNQFYVMHSGGIAGMRNFNGPLGLPADASFKGKSYSLAQVKLIQAAAVKTVKPPQFHASPTLQSASYSMGMGIQPPPGVYGGPRVNLTVTFPNITYKPTTSVEIDERAKTMAVTVDASEGNPQSRAMTRPEDLMIPVNRPETIGAEYKLIVKDYKGKVLSQSKFTNWIPA
jgi:hypothetical protein